MGSLVKALPVAGFSGVYSVVAVFSLPLSFKLKEKHNSPSSEFGGSSMLCQQNQRTVEALGAAWHIHRLSWSSAPNPAQPPAE